MGKRNGYLERRKIRDEVMQDAIRQTYQQRYQWLPEIRYDGKR